MNGNQGFMWVIGSIIISVAIGNMYRPAIGFITLGGLILSAVIISIIH